MDTTPVIVIGAPRSGTKLLRDIVCGFEGFGTWPCDEINYIWRYGNRAFPTDELTPEHATQKVTRFIRHAFEKQHRRLGGGSVVEKTCANSLRVSFVDHIFPEATFVYIVRDGCDAVASAMHRWTARVDVRYLARKARFVPARDLPFYSVRYLRANLHRLKSGKQGRLGWWGPRFEGMLELQRGSTLPEVCAYQWKRCVEQAEEQLRLLDSRRVHRVEYEQLVEAPKMEIERLGEFLAVDALSNTPPVNSHGIGRWRTALSDVEMARVQAIIRRP